MKTITLLISLFTLLISNQALAHTDDALGEVIHFAYHIAFYGLIVFTAFKVIRYFKSKQ